MASKTIATQYFMKSYDDSLEARKAINKLGVIVSNDNDVLIFTSGKKNTNCYTRECNGLILEKNTYKILAIPPRNLVKNIDFDSVNRLLYQGLYKIYKINEGSIITFYYYNNEWRLSTSNGCNVANNKWDKKTYKEMVVECLEIYDISWDDFIKTLDTKHCYSFGFKHPDIHKFKDGKDYNVWFVHSINLDEEDPNYLWASNQSPIEKNSNQEEVRDVADVKDLYKTASESLDVYLNCKEHKVPVYGFIMRSINIEIAGSYSDIIIESSLFKAIKNIWYDRNINKLCFDDKLEKESIIPLFAYLDQRKYENFNLLFPEYKPKLDFISLQLDRVSDSAVLLINGDSTDTKHAEVAKKILIQYKLDNVKLDLKTKSNEDKKRIIHSYMCHISFLYYLLPLMS